MKQYHIKTSNKNLPSKYESTMDQKLYSQRTSLLELDHPALVYLPWPPDAAMTS